MSNWTQWFCAMVALAFAVVAMAIAVWKSDRKQNEAMAEQAVDAETSNVIPFRRIA